jgi:ferritin-like protein
MRIDQRPTPGDLQGGEEGRIRRSTFLTRAVMLAGALAGGELVLYGAPRLTVSAPSPAQDRAIFAFTLALEELQSAFYAKALSRGQLKGEQLQFAQTVGAQEDAHLAYLRTQVGSSKVKQRTFAFGASTTTASGFLSAAVAIEELGLEAYNGQAPNLTSAGLRAAGRIIPVEARHVAWARSLNGELPAPVASDKGLSQPEVLSRARQLGYAL